MVSLSDARGPGPAQLTETLRLKTAYIRDHYLAHYFDHYLWVSDVCRPLADTPCFSLSLFWLHQVVIKS